MESYDIFDLLWFRFLVEFNLCNWWHLDLTAKGKHAFALTASLTCFAFVLLLQTFATSQKFYEAPCLQALLISAVKTVPYPNAEANLLFKKFITHS